MDPMQQVGAILIAVAFGLLFVAHWLFQLAADNPSEGEPPGWRARLAVWREQEHPSTW